MDELVKELEELTLAFVAKLETAAEEEIVQFVEAREAIVSRMKQSEYSSEELEKLGQRIQSVLSYDDSIKARMMTLKSEASAGLMKFDQARMQKNAYEANYAWESAFVDKRK
ncbi:hypothetical protein [Paenibacillus hamazuiensis]|uniref:hypothetical protein n=1 Tax=Paenibacillus hamazuiensis TaxID=2936508 RepID=UPI00200CD7F2|nr:hypothetical protein [Paenibacillus hamazuiensis]